MTLIIDEDPLRRLQRWGVEPFAVGSVRHPLPRRCDSSLKPQCETVLVRQPGRLNAMLLDYSLFVTADPENWLRAGSVAFGIELLKTATISLKGELGELQLDCPAQRRPVVRHAVAVMRAALGRCDGLAIRLEEDSRLTHVGLGSTPAVQVAVGAGLNCLYGNPLSNRELMLFLLRNYGEEIDGDPDHLLPVQAMGAAAAVGLFGGGLIVLAGEASVVGRMSIPDAHRFVIATPRDYRAGDSAAALAADVNTYLHLSKIGSEARAQVAYDVLNVVLPAMAATDLRTIGDVIERHRLNSSQIERYEMRYPGWGHVLRFAVSLRERGTAEVVSVSSTGPTLFALTSDPRSVCDGFENRGYQTSVVPPNNVGTTCEQLPREEQ